MMAAMTYINAIEERNVFQRLRACPVRLPVTCIQIHVRRSRRHLGQLPGRGAVGYRGQHPGDVCPGQDPVTPQIT